MVVTPLVALWIAMGVGAIVAVGEWLHARRVQRVARLAFGESGSPRTWVALVPPLRIAAATAAMWGLLVLGSIDPRTEEIEPSRGASRHLLIALDVSPSMLLEDSGPETEKVRRGVWAGTIVQGVLDRLDMATTRITLSVFYTDALPVLSETFDKAVVANALDGLQMYTAFEPGSTKLQEGVEKALDLAKPWMPGSATFIVVSDGDSITAPPPSRVPASIADVIVIGVGDPYKGSTIAGHNSKQDVASLKQLAARLRGTYHQGNTKHLPSAILEKLTMIEPRIGESTGLRELALFATAVGAFVLAGLGPALGVAGRRRIALSSPQRGVLHGDIA